MSIRGVIATVGGSPGPLIKTIKEHEPEYVLFIVSTGEDGTKPVVMEKILPGLTGSLPQYAFCELADAQCLESCHKEIGEHISRWLKEYQLDRGGVVVDYTGGTKAMTAALVLAAVDECIDRFAYVGAKDKGRDRNNRGVVIAGYERIISARNPLQARAIREIEQANRLLESFYATPAAEVLEQAASICDAKHQPVLQDYAKLAEALGHADRFQFDKAVRSFSRCRNRLQLPAIFSHSIYELMLSHCERWGRIHEALQSVGVTPGEEVLLELLANADRRAKQERYDDAVGRLYRVVELYGQQRAKESLDMELGQLDLEALDADKREHLKKNLGLGEPNENGKHLLGVQKLYRLMELEGDSEPGKYDQMMKHLSVRNVSLLAHGQMPVSEEVFESFWRATLEGLGINGETDIPRWPKIELKPPS